MPAERGSMRFPIIVLGVILTVITVGLLVINQLQFIPYNIRELIVKEYPVLSSFLFACFISWSFGFPVLIAMWFKKSSGNIWHCLGLMALHGVLAWIFLRYAVPIESIHDIVGSPILSWPFDLEIIIRFLSLYLIITFTTTLSSLVFLFVYYGYDKMVLVKILFCGLIIVSISHFVVFEKAATDNLTELIVAGGSIFSSLLLFLFLLILTLASSQIGIFATKVNRKSIKVIVLSCLILFPSAFLCIYGATEKKIIKYGQEFSALQFLLSSDRRHLVEMPQLLIRYAIGHTVLMLLIALVQIPFWILVLNIKQQHRSLLIR